MPEREEIEAKLNEWRGKLDTLKVKGSLLKMEFRDQKDDVVKKLESALEAAKGKYEEIKDSEEAQHAAKFVKAGAEKAKASAAAALAALKAAYEAHTDESADDEGSDTAG